MRAGGAAIRRVSMLLQISIGHVIIHALHTSVVVVSHTQNRVAAKVLEVDVDRYGWPANMN